MSSTELTNGGAESASAPVDAPSSGSLRLALALSRVHGTLMGLLVEALVGRGHANASAATLGFLGQLDCGVNHAAEIARRLGVSRQMVSRTVRELERQGVLTLAPDPEKGNRKVILFTEEGRRLMDDARAVLAELDGALAREGSGARLPALIGELEAFDRALGTVRDAGPGGVLPGGDAADIASR